MPQNQAPITDREREGGREGGGTSLLKHAKHKMAGNSPLGRKYVVVMKPGQSALAQALRPLTAWIYLMLFVATCNNVKLHLTVYNYCNVMCNNQTWF